SDLAKLQQCRYEHGNALIGDAHRHTGAGELLGDDARFENIRLRAIAAIFLRNRARRITMLDQQALPFEQFRTRPRDGETPRRLAAVPGKKIAHFLTEGVVLRPIGEIHGVLPAMTMRLPARGAHAWFLFVAEV